MLVGLIGRKRSGKDTLAAALIARHGFTRYAFADPLKAAALALDPIVAERVPSRDLGGEIRLSTVVGAHGWEDAKELPEVRRTLQALGVAMREHVAEDVWLRATLEPALTACELGRPVVVTDVRFPNEAQAIEDADGFLVRVTRPGLPDDGDRHVSETALDEWGVDLIVENDGTVADLDQAADWIFESITELL